MLDNFKNTNFMKSGNGYSLFSGLLGSAVTNSLSDLANYKSRMEPQFQPSLFNSGIPMLALGGIGVGSRRVEVEGGEVKEDKFGNVSKFKGASHQQGGIKTNIESGDIVFSDRLKIDGKTLAERKILRDKLLKRLDSMESGSKINKASNERIRANLQKQQESDLAFQSQFNQENQQKLGFGTQPIPTLGYNNFLLNVPGFDKPQGFGYDETPKLPTLNPQIDPPSPDAHFNQLMSNLSSFKGGDVDNSTYNKTTGDLIGQAGTIFGGLAPLFNTINNRMGDTPNINPFKNYGKEGLQNNRNLELLASQQRDRAYNDIAANETATRDRIRNSTRGLNTLRALETNVDNSVNKNQSKANQAFQAQMMRILNQRTSLLNRRDQAVMQGEASRDMNNRKDRDVFYSNLGKNLANIANKTQEFARNENIVRSNQDKMELLNSMSSHGFRYTNDGIIQTKDGKDIHKQDESIILDYAKDLKGEARKIYFSDINIARKKEGLTPIKYKNK